MTDRLELARQRAAALHFDAVAAGRNPHTPYEFARGEAERRGIEVSRVPVGDVRLCGGRAVFDPDAWLILHEDSGCKFTDAFLVSHEIGHVELGGEADFFAVSDVDPIRSSGSTGVGTDWVVDYSSRERREVQMDLFAREFLLPRSWMRVLHLEQEQSATEISALVGAPKPVVFQQLLDAVLLPVMEVGASQSHGSTLAYNDSQSEAMRYSGDTAFMLKAGPGTGKTRTLIGRVEHLVESGVAPERILVLTFSNKAAGELSERLAAMNPDAAAKVWVGTFHSFGLDIVRRFHDKLNLPCDPSLVDRADAISMLEHAYAGLDLKHLKNLQYPSLEISRALDAISRAHDEVVGVERYCELADHMLSDALEEDDVIRAEQCVDVATIFAAYETQKSAKGRVDFGDLVSMPVRLCEQDSEVREYLSTLYEHVLVDEFQDVNRASVRLLKALSPNGKNLWVVGDARQSIYRFRGASLFNIQRFCNDDFPGGVTGELDLSYRSVPEVNQVVHHFASTTMGATGEPVATNRGSLGHCPEVHVVEEKTGEVLAIADAITSMLKSGHRYRDQAVLCTGNDRLAEIARDLERLGIPVLFLGNLFERSEIRDLLSLVSLLVDGRTMGLLRTATMCEFTMQISDVSAVIDQLRAQKAKPMDWSKGTFVVESLTPGGKESLDNLGIALGGFHTGSNPWTVLATLLFDRTRMAANLASVGDVPSRAKSVAIWQFMNFARHAPGGRGTPTFRLLERIRQLVLNSDDRELRQLPKAADGIDAVRLMTMHGSKGLESGVVHIPGLTSAGIPRSAGSQLSGVVTPPDGMIEGTTDSGYEAVKSGLEAEQASLFFVALSRAEDRLFLYRNEKRSDDKKQSASKFLTCLNGVVLERHIAPASAFNDTVSETATRITVEEPFCITDHHVRLYHKCPRRFLYAHVLESGGRRMETPYMKLHDAVQDVVNHAALNPGVQLSRKEAEKLLLQAMSERGFSDDEAALEFRKIASDLVRYLVACSSEIEFLPSEPGQVEITGGKVVVTPDQVFRDENGNAVVRRIRTGHLSSEEAESLESTALQISAEIHSDRDSAEIVNLADGKRTPLKMSKTKLDNRHVKLNAIGASIVSGRFSIKESKTCPLCPAYFICGNLPVGEMSKKISD
ncbi:ATP-dependent DNA helicase PcrA [Rubripirellula tenax]|uniref:DNA 3'-5' helicase n=1 Tax=Rubripirellula tenax TaxID=2528015 RepID=A0A5C6FBY1_9BACT|nr:ATP-dependent helicase [Rubripirellula tenax]TWU58945.1 ATP-dependent DNA helicase PcrA [Rubripirellula tenax]